MIGLRRRQLLGKKAAEPAAWWLQCVLRRATLRCQWKAAGLAAVSLQLLSGSRPETHPGRGFFGGSDRNRCSSVRSGAQVAGPPCSCPLASWPRWLPHAPAGFWDGLVGLLLAAGCLLGVSSAAVRLGLPSTPPVPLACLFR